MVCVIPEDRSKDAWIAATWKQEWEVSTPTRVHRHVLDPGEGVKGEDLSTVVPATAGHRWFRGKVALRGRWPLVTGNGHMRHYVKSNTHIRQHIFHSTCTTL